MGVHFTAVADVACVALRVILLAHWHELCRLN